MKLPKPDGQWVVEGHKANEQGAEEERHDGADDLAGHRDERQRRHHGEDRELDQRKQADVQGRHEEVAHEHADVEGRVKARLVGFDFFRQELGKGARNGDGDEVGQDRAEDRQHGQKRHIEQVPQRDQEVVVPNGGVRFLPHEVEQVVGVAKHQDHRADKQSACDDRWRYSPDEQLGVLQQVRHPSKGVRKPGEERLPLTVVPAPHPPNPPRRGFLLFVAHRQPIVLARLSSAAVLLSLVVRATEGRQLRSDLRSATRSLARSEVVPRRPIGRTVRFLSARLNTIQNSCAILPCTAAHDGLAEFVASSAPV